MQIGPANPARAHLEQHLAREDGWAPWGEWVREDWLREVWAEAAAPSELNRMLAYDWRYTLAENVAALRLVGEFERRIESLRTGREVRLSGEKLADMHGGELVKAREYGVTEAIIARLANIARYQAQWRADLSKFDAALRDLAP